MTAWRAVRAACASTLASGAAALAVSVSAARSPDPPAAAPQRAWVIADPARGVPLVDEGSVYFLTRDRHLVSADAATGDVRWRRRIGGRDAPPRGSTIVATRQVVVAGDEELIAMDKATGAVTWRFSPGEHAAVGVFLGTAAAGVIVSGSAVGRVFAADASTGALAWSTAVADEPATVFWPAAASGLVVAAYTMFRDEHRGGVAALDARTGRVRWRTPFPGANATSNGAGWAGGPLIVEDLVIAAGGDGQIHALDARTGASRWSLPPATRAALAGDFRPLDHASRRLFAGSMTGVLTAYDLETPAPVWRYSPPRSGSMAFALKSDEGTIYVPYAGGWLAAVRAEDGIERWRTPFGGFLWPPAVSGSLVYAASSTEGLCAFRR